MSEITINKETIENNEKIQTTISIQEVVVMCDNFINNNTSEEDFVKWADGIMIKKYLPLVEKQKIVNTLIMKFFSYELTTSTMFIGDLEMDKFFEGLLAYTNIEIKGYEEFLSSTTYDLIMMCLGQVILAICGYDYNILMDMFNNAVNVKNIVGLMDKFNVINAETAKHQSNDLKKVLEAMSKNSDIMDKVTEIFKINNQINK